MAPAAAEEEEEADDSMSAAHGAQPVDRIDLTYGDKSPLSPPPGQEDLGMSWPEPEAKPAGSNTSGSSSGASSPTTPSPLQNFIEAPDVDLAVDNTEKFDAHLKQIACFGEAQRDKLKAATKGNDVLLAKAAESGEFCLRTAVGAKWTRDLKSSKKLEAEYEACKGRKAKAECRARWAKTTYSKVIKEKTYTERYQEINETLGEYFTLGGVVKEFGGWTWPPAVQGAKRLAAKAVMMGGKWSYVDTQSELRFFLVLKKINRELMENAWALFETEVHNSDNVPTDPVAAASTAARADQGVGKPEKDKAEATPGKKPKTPAKKGKAATTGDEQNTDDNKEAPAATKEKKLVADMNRLKGQVNKHLTVAESLIKQIKDNKAYEWAQNDQNLGVLQMDLAKLRGMMSPFHHEFLLVDARVMKERVGAAVFLSEMSCFKATEVVLESLVQTIKTIMKRTNVRP